MAKKLYVGNLPYELGSDGLTELFAQTGEVETAVIVVEKESGKSKGFGFVEMARDEDAKAAVVKFNGYILDNRNLKVEEAKPVERRNDRRDQGSSNRGGKSFERRDGNRGDRPFERRDGNRGGRPFERRTY